MGKMSRETSKRRLTILLGSFALLANSASAWAYNYLPDDPFHISYYLSLYSHFASLLGALGLVGAKTGNAMLVHIFSNFLLIDSTLCAVPRVVFIFLFLRLRESVCSEDFVTAWEQRLSSSSTLWNQRTSTGGGTEFVRRWMAQHWSRQTCLMAGWWVEVVLGLVVLTCTAAQLSMAMAVREYATLLSTDEGRMQEKPWHNGFDCDDEKAPGAMQQEIV